MNTVDLKFLSWISISPRIEGFTKKQDSPYRANMRCPFCGDSQKSTRKKRGWLLEYKNQAWYYCHNCNISLSFCKFIANIDPFLSKEYNVSQFIEKNSFKIETKPSKSSLKKQFLSLDRLEKISQLDDNHPAKKYINERKIPAREHYRLYYVSKFNNWVNSIIPDKIKVNNHHHHDDSRIVLPFCDEKGNAYGFQGRSFNSQNSTRYITIMLNDYSPKIFGLDRVDFCNLYYVLEGPIDSLFLNNSIAMAGADVNIKELNFIKNATFVFDREPRNKEIVKRIERCISQGYRVCIWPNIMEGRGKDINDFILSGLSSDDIQLIIKQSSYVGLQARLELTKWRKFK